MNRTVKPNDINSAKLTSIQIIQCIFIALPNNEHGTTPFREINITDKTGRQNRIFGNTSAASAKIAFATDCLFAMFIKTESASTPSPPETKPEKCCHASVDICKAKYVNLMETNARYMMMQNAATRYTETSVRRWDSIASHSRLPKFLKKDQPSRRLLSHWDRRPNKPRSRQTKQ